MTRKTPKHDIQYRTSLDFRAANDDSGFEGHAASWWSVDAYGTAMAPGAFTKTISERKDRIPVLWNHNADVPVGKHLDIREDDAGLYVNIGIADDGAEGTTLLKRLRYGVPLGMSFGFVTLRDRAARDEDPLDLTTAPAWMGEDADAIRSNTRVITEVQYWESSPVTFPANENSTIDAIRSARIEQEADYLTSLMEALRSESFDVDDARVPLLHDLVAVYQERAAAGAFTEATTAPEPEPTRRNPFAEYQLLTLTVGAGD